MAPIIRATHPKHRSRMQKRHFLAKSLHSRYEAATMNVKRHREKMTVRIPRSYSSPHGAAFGARGSATYTESTLYIFIS